MPLGANFSFHALDEGDQHWRIHQTADQLHDELVIDSNNIYPSHALGLECLILVNVTWDLGAACSNERSQDADLSRHSVREQGRTTLL